MKKRAILILIGIISLLFITYKILPGLEPHSVKLDKKVQLNLLMKLINMKKYLN